MKKILSHLVFGGNSVYGLISGLFYLIFAVAVVVYDLTMNDVGISTYIFMTIIIIEPFTIVSTYIANEK